MQIGIVYYLSMNDTRGLFAIYRANLLRLKKLFKEFYIDCFKCENNAAILDKRNLIVIFVNNFCFLNWWAQNVIYQHHFALGMWSRTN